MAKLIRDKIPEIIENTGKKPVTRIADDDEYWDKLKLKLCEEVEEFIKGETEDELKEELVDIFEVMNAISEFKQFDKEELKLIQTKKAEKRGRFNHKIILDHVK